MLLAFPEVNKLANFRITGIAFGNTNTNPLKRFLVELVLFVWVGLLLCVLGVRTHMTTFNNDEVFKKYFGPDFKISYDDSYSLIISNHISWMVI